MFGSCSTCGTFSHGSIFLYIRQKKWKERRECLMLAVFLTGKLWICKLQSSHLHLVTKYHLEHHGEFRLNSWVFSLLHLCPGPFWFHTGYREGTFVPQFPSLLLQRALCLTFYTTPGAALDNLVGPFQLRIFCDCLAVLCVNL